ncbi:MAG: hypothetical protein K2H85_00065 [Allobaculum sp.]|nr:hypothetical protein [Allobaculum sp.]
MGVTQEQVDEFRRLFGETLRNMSTSFAICNFTEDQFADPIFEESPFAIGDDYGNKFVEFGPGMETYVEFVKCLLNSLDVLAGGNPAIRNLKIALHAPALFYAPEFFVLGRVGLMFPSLYIPSTPEGYKGISGSEMDVWIEWLKGHPENKAH